MSEPSETSSEGVEIEIVDIFTSAGHDFRGRHRLARRHHAAERHDRVECVAGCVPAS